MDIREIIMADAQITGGQTVFRNSRVPIETLFDHLDGGSLDEFLDQFPTVTKEQAVGLLKWISQLFSYRKPDQLYASFS